MSQPIDIIEKKRYHPKDPDYFKTYFQENNKGVLVPCPRCNRCTSKHNLSKHMKRNICLKRCVVDITLELASRLGLNPEPISESDQEEQNHSDLIASENDYLNSTN